MPFLHTHQLLQTEEGKENDLISVIPTVSIRKGRDVREGDNQPGEFVVNLNAPAPEGGLEVQYSVNGTATQGQDYNNLTDSITVAAGETQVVLPVQAKDDEISEPKKDDEISEPKKEETVEVTLVPPSVRGLTGEYFKDKNLQNLAFTRTDSTVEFDWKEGSPDRDKVEDNDFSIRWSGYVQPKYSETYTFTTTSDDDDGIRLWVNGESLIDELIRKSPATGASLLRGASLWKQGKPIL